MLGRAELLTTAKRVEPEEPWIKRSRTPRFRTIAARWAKFFPCELPPPKLRKKPHGKPCRGLSRFPVRVCRSQSPP